MKTIIIPDVHGRTYWKNIIHKHTDATQVIFLGDYFDTYGLETPEQEIENFLEIIDFAEQHGNTSLLIGNHDLHYLDFSIAPCSRFNDQYAQLIHDTIFTHKDKLQFAKFVDGSNNVILCTHAGVSLEFLDRYHYSNVIPIDVFLNTLPYKVYSFESNVTKMSDYYGVSQTHSPVWIRDIMNPIPKTIQIFGHTKVGNIGMINRNGGVLIGCDTFSNKTIEYLIVEDNNIKIEKLNVI